MRSQIYYVPLLWIAPALWLPAAEPKSPPPRPIGSEKSAVAQIHAGKQPQGFDQRFVYATGRIEELGGRFEFDDSGKLVGVDLASDRVSVADADIPLLLALPNLTKLKLSGGGIGGPGIEHVGKLSGLTELSLLDVQVDNASLGQLAQLANLRSLIIRRSPLLNDEGLQHLNRLPKLTSLGLLEVGVTDRGVATLVKDLPQLRLLDLRGCSQVGDPGIEHLRAMKSLKVLRLSGYQTTDATLAIIGSLGRLNGLTIEDAAITDAGLTRLAGLPLDEINLGRCYSITDDGLRRLKGFANLRQLGISGIPINGSGLKYLSRSDKLVRLKLSETGVRDSAIEPLRGLKNLTRLELRQTQITDAALEIVGGMTKLEYLDIAQTGVSDEGAKRLAQSLPKCKIVRK